MTADVLKKVAGFLGALLFTMTIAQEGQAHNRFEVDAAAGYRFGSGLDLTRQDDGALVNSGRLFLKSGFIWSGILGVRVQPDKFLYLSYTRQDLGFKYVPEETKTADFTSNGSLEYFQFGGNVEMTNGIMVPYLGFSVGVARFYSSSPPADESGNRFFFSAVLDGGMKIDLHKHVHLRLIGRLPFTLVKKDIFCDGASCAHAEKMSPLAHVEGLGGIGVSF